MGVGRRKGGGGGASNRHRQRSAQPKAVLGETVREEVSKRRDGVASRQLEVHIISSKDQVTDIMTKPLPGPAFTKICNNLNSFSYRPD
jgi:hypothetical protein